MALVRLENITLSYPILATERARIQITAPTEGAGSLIRDTGNLTRSVVAIDRVSLDLKDGDKLGLIGRNGSGKSTLLRVIAGIYEPQSGRVRVEGTIAGLFSIGLGMSSDSTGYRNIILSGLVSGYSRKQIEAILPEIAEFTELGEYLNMPVRTYSNGMAMRLKFACATAFDADVLLMDEWLGAGDPDFREKAENRLNKLVDKAGIMILATHNHRLLKRSCNKLAWMDRGCLRAIGNVDEVLAIYDEAHRKPPPVRTAEEIEEIKRARRIEASREKRREAARAQKREEIRARRREEIRAQKRELARKEARKKHEDGPKSTDSLSPAAHSGDKIGSSGS